MSKNIVEGAGRFEKHLLKQVIVLELLNSKRYSYDVEKDIVISHIGKQPRVIGFTDINGYKQYGLDTRFKTSVRVYGHLISYLNHWKQPFDPQYVIDHIDRNKANNHWSNLRIVTQKENLENSDRQSTKGSKIERVRHDVSTKQAMYKDFLDDMSYVAIAKKYKTTRQTVARIVKEIKLLGVSAF